MDSLRDTLALNNGYAVPCVGFGTWQTPDGETAVRAVKAAVACGYRHIDTAAVYGNERSVGKAVAECGLPRSDLFLTSKLWNSLRGYKDTTAAFKKTLSDLKTDYLDLYLIHWPAVGPSRRDWEALILDTWKAFEDLYGEGLIRALGVSNFLPHHLAPLLEHASVKPMVDQIEFHPGYTQPETVRFCRGNGILVEAWSPLGSGRTLSDPTLAGIAKKYGKSTAQLCIRWCMQNGTVPLPKSVTPARIAENAQVFDFCISDADMALINAMPVFAASGMHPDRMR